MNEYKTSRFWLNTSGSLFQKSTPSVLEADENYLTCTYLPKGAKEPKELFKIRWEDLKGSYYSEKRWDPNGLSIFAKDGSRFTFSRQATFKRIKSFPEVLTAMCPEEGKIPKDSFFSTQTISPYIRSLESVLRKHNVLAYVPTVSEWERKNKQL